MSLHQASSVSVFLWELPSPFIVWLSWQSKVSPWWRNYFDVVFPQVFYQLPKLAERPANFSLAHSALYFYLSIPVFDFVGSQFNP